jgi:NAD(P)-dependent dehydrogenase (short-subunit alcohol dehydrogenase family)
VIGVNLSGAFYVARWVFPALERGGGALVNIASINATNTFRNRAAYNASKAGLLSLTQTLAVEWAPRGVRVLAVSPGFTRTSMMDQGIRAGRTNEQQIVGYTPQQRILRPEEIASAIVRLVGDDFSGLTGSNVLIDGGFDAWGGRF